MSGFICKLKTTLNMIKFEHTLFALPFALLGAVLAEGGIPAGEKIGWIVAAMVGARSSAMTFNRIIDRRFDAENPRTANREIPTGRLSVGFAWGFLVANIMLFIFAAYRLNPLALKLAPVALLFILGYSFAKRFTSLAHIILGMGLAISPCAAWIGVKGSLDDPAPIFLSLMVMMWTAGFDVLYACQDFDFDRQAGLRSIPSRFGIARALMIARLFHLQAFFALLVFYMMTGLGWPALLGVVVTGLLLVYQHTLVKKDDLSRLNAAFFTTNAFVSVILLVAFGAGVLMKD
ncbi:MAG: UbiA-like polyprenyltransferase [Acidobacteriota bacterium]